MLLLPPNLPRLPSWKHSLLKAQTTLQHLLQHGTEFIYVDISLPHQTGGASCEQGSRVNPLHTSNASVQHDMGSLPAGRLQSLAVFSSSP